MQSTKQKLYRKIDKMPDEMTKRVLDFVEQLEFGNDNINGPESLKIKSKQDFIEKIQAANDEIDTGRYHSLEETLAFLRTL